MVSLKGAFTALVTPMKENGEVDYEEWRRLINYQIDGGINGLVPLGTTGEAPTLEEDEEEKLLAICKEEVKGRVPIIAGASSNSTKHMVQYVKRAKDLGADAALVVTPYYNKPNDQGLIQHFQAAGAVGIPIIIYNIASRTGRNIQTSLMTTLAKIPNIAGVKEASGDINQIADVINLLGKGGDSGFVVLSGDDAMTLPLMAFGGHGVISVISNLVPGKVAALTDACSRGDFVTASKLHFELLPLTKAAFIETNPIPIKAAMSIAGLPGGTARLPLGPVAPATEEALCTAMRGLGFSV